MSTLKWVKCHDGLQQVRPTPEGRLNVKQIASNFGLDVDSIKFNGILETYNSSGFTTEVIPGGQAEDSAITVTGRPAAGKSYAGQGHCPRLPARSLPVHYDTVEIQLYLHSCHPMFAPCLQRCYS